MAQTPSQRMREPLQLRGRDAVFHLSSLELILLPVALLIACFIGYSAYARVTELDAAPTVTPTTYVPAFRTNLSTTIQASGTVQATQQVNLNFGASGKITAIEVAAGTNVVAGEVLARLDDSQLQAALKSAQTNLASAQARLDSAIAPSAADTSSALASIATSTNNVTSAEKALADLRANQPPPTWRVPSRPCCPHRMACRAPRTLSPTPRRR